MLVDVSPAQLKLSLHKAQEPNAQQRLLSARMNAESLGLSDESFATVELAEEHRFFSDFYRVMVFRIQKA